MEVAHEALIQEWPALRGWLEEDREGLRLHRHLTLAAEGWERQGRDPGDLYRGARLEQAAGWAEAHQEALSELEQAFLDASQAQARQEEAEREAQRQRELTAAQALAETERRSVAQLRRRALYLFGAFILALILGGAALFQGEVARQSAVTAQNERRIAYGRELAAAADNNLEIDPERGILLALQAISTTRTINGTVLPEAVEALHRAIVSSQVRYTLTCHNTWVLSTDFSPDGKHLATIGQDGTTIIWDTGNGKEVLRLPGATPYNDAVGMQRVAYSPDGTRPVTGDSAFVKVWDAASGALMMTLTGHTGEVWAVAFSPDGKEIASGARDGTLRVWDATTGETRLVMTGHQDAIEGLAFSPDGKRLATGSDDQTLKIWDAENGALLNDLKDFPAPVVGVAFSPDGKKLATTSDTIKIWDTQALDNGALLTIPEGAGSTTFSPDGNLLAGSIGSTAMIWDANTGRKLLTLAGHRNWVEDVAFSPDGKRLATVSYDETAKIWNILPGQEAATLSGNGSRVVYSPDGTRLATEGSDGTARLWDAETGEALLTLSGHKGALLGIAFSPDGKRLATASLDKTAKVWDTSTGQLELTLTGHDIAVRDVAFSQDGTRIATAGFDQTARIWDAVTGQELLKLTGHDGLVLGVAFNPDGTRLATSSTDKTAKIWDAKTGQLIFTLEGHFNPIPDIAYSPDGSRVATGSQDGTAKIWDASTGKELLTLRGIAPKFNR